jgi:hypothetical protein
VRTLIIAVILAASVSALPAAAKPPSDSVTYRMQKDPLTAVLLSVAFPGLGQVYNAEYWKAPLFAGTAGTSLYLLLDNHGKFRDADAAYLAAKDGGGSASNLDLLLRRREAFRDNRDISAAVLITTYVVAAVDAFVGAHLFDFDVSDDVSMHVGPRVQAPIALTMIARF